MKSAVKSAQRDKRITALRRFAVSITAFTLAGHLVLGLEASWAQPVVALATAYTLDLLLETLDAWARRREVRFKGGLRELVDFLLPGHIAALAIALLIFPGERLWPFVFAVSVAIGAKHIFRAPVGGRSRHFMNPSNLGIAATLTVFPWVGIAPPYHFTAGLSGPLDWVVPAAILGSGLVLNTQLTGKWPLIAAWVGGFVLQAAVRSVMTGVALDAALAPMTGAAFVLFTNYMITDPGTSPVRREHQVVFGLVAALAYGVLMSLHVVYGLFYAVVATCALRGLLLWALAFHRAWRGAAAPAVEGARVRKVAA